jgi:hypothetical protein
VTRSTEEAITDLLVNRKKNQRARSAQTVRQVNHVQLAGKAAGALAGWAGRLHAGQAPDGCFRGAPFAEYRAASCTSCAFGLPGVDCNLHPRSACAMAFGRELPRWARMRGARGMPRSDFGPAPLAFRHLACRLPWRCTSFLLLTSHFLAPRKHHVVGEGPEALCAALRAVPHRREGIFTIFLFFPFLSLLLLGMLIFSGPLFFLFPS